MNITTKQKLEENNYVIKELENFEIQKNTTTYFEFDIIADGCKLGSATVKELLFDLHGGIRDETKIEIKGESVSDLELAQDLIKFKIRFILSGVKIGQEFVNAYVTLLRILIESKMIIKVFDFNCVTGKDGYFSMYRY